MTKTKRQLRAEAVERLKAINAHIGMSYTELLDALIPGLPRNSQETQRALIDLLTDDDEPTVRNEASDGELFRCSYCHCKVYNIEMTEGDCGWGFTFCPQCGGLVDEHDSRKIEAELREPCSENDDSLRETPDSAENPQKSARNAKDDASDTREKLEADIDAIAHSLRNEAMQYVPSFNGYGTREKLESLANGLEARMLEIADRQKAITEREVGKRLRGLQDTYSEASSRRKAGIAELQSQLEAATARLVDVECARGRLVSENGKLLGRLERRALPEGVEWPRFEDGALVKFGDCARWNPDGVKESSIRVSSIEFTTDWGKVEAFVGNESCKVAYAPDEPIHRPPVLAKDGKPIAVGETLYGEDGRAWTVKGIRHGSNHPVQGAGDGGLRRDLKPEWLAHEQPDSARRIIGDLIRAVCDKVEESGGTVTEDFGIVTQDYRERIERLAGGAS